MLGDFWKNGETDNSSPQDGRPEGIDYVVSRRPLIASEPHQQSWHVQSQDFENLGELPRTYGKPVFFGIARDPHTLFTYWEIDWPTIFGDRPPVDRKVYLRTISKDGREEARVAVEPMAGSHTVAVANARSTYQIELGYDEPAEVWNSVAISATIATPPDGVSPNDEINVATVPFHMSFQRLIDSFRAAKYDEETLVTMVGELQRRVDDSAGGELTLEDLEILRTLESTLSESSASERSRLRKSGDHFATRQQIQSILGIGGSSRG